MEISYDPIKNARNMAERGIRVISFRKANAREGEHHGFTLTRH